MIVDEGRRMMSDLFSVRRALSGCVVCLGALLTSTALASAASAADAGLKKLSPGACTALAQSVLKPTLAATWHAFLPYTKVCTLRKSANASVAVYLVSVFANDYYHATPNEKDWKSFPLPLLLGANGNCLAQLPELYPHDEPRELSLFYGHWQNNMPTRITINVRNPAAGGNYHLPALVWDAKKQQYLAPKSTDEHSIEETQCPI